MGRKVAWKKRTSRMWSLKKWRYKKKKMEIQGYWKKKEKWRYKKVKSEVERV